MSKFAIACTGLALCLSLVAACASRSEPAPAPSAGADSPVAATGEGTQFQVANTTGELISVEQALVPGKVTVIDFYADWCAPCKALEKKLAGEIAGEARIAVRKIDVGSADVPDVVERYGVRNLPHVRIYGPDGTLLHDLPGTEAERTGALALEAVGTL
ncbi:thioredoxin domain-containing protein [Haliangium sp.]|uniref:thioredoxin family protein n=1 Tax=Haliangium sp. TaxID=2663208 RepID=UPI003D10171B